MTLEQIKAPVAQYVENYHQSFDEILACKSQWLGEAINLLKQSSGKMLRPILTCLCSGLVSGKVSELAINSGLLLELIHTATLIHDDVIDEAKTRRGKPTLGAIYDNRVAVLMGDFVLSSALIAATQTKNIRIIGIVSKIGRELSEGEIRQYESAKGLILSQDNYLEVIRQKTAILFRYCAEVAAIASEASEEDIARLGLMAELLGLAFQIRDDIFDYYTDGNIGKPTGNDIREGKVTLPLLYILTNHCLSPQEQSYYEGLLQQEHIDEEAVRSLIDLAKERGGIAYAEQQMQSYISQAKALIEQYPESTYRQALLGLADYIALRHK